MSATIEGLAELEAEALVAPCDDLRPPDWFGVRFVTAERTDEPHRWRPYLPRVSASYRLVHRYRENVPWFLDPDLFQRNLDDLGMDERTRRTLDEAIDAVRRGLYLAGASLLGAVSEAMWFALGEQVVTPSATNLANALKHNKTDEVIRLVASVLRQRGLSRFENVLLPQAQLFREIRNYGVHPRSDLDPNLERFFQEDATAILFLGFHHYLDTLREVSARLAESAHE